MLLLCRPYLFVVVSRFLHVSDSPDAILALQLFDGSLHPGSRFVGDGGLDFKQWWSCNGADDNFGGGDIDACPLV